MPVVTAVCVNILMHLLLGADPAGSGGLASPVPAQSGPTPDATLSGWVPATAEFFIETSRLSSLDTALRRTRVMNAISFFAGRGAQVAPGADLSRSVGALLGVTEAKLLDRILSCPAIWAAPSWRELDGAVILLRIPGDELLTAWFPPSRRTKVTREERTLVFDSGRFRVATRENLVAVVRNTAPQALFDGVVTQLRSRREAGWSADPVFRRLAGPLKAPTLLRVGLRRTAAQPVGAVEPMRVEFGFEMAVVSVHESGAALEIDLRAKMPDPQSHAPSSRAAHDLIRRLPATTLAAWAMTSDWRENVQGLLELVDADPSSVMMQRIEIALPLRAALTEVISQTRPPVVLVWGRPEAEQPSFPQFAAFLECDDAAVVAASLSTILQAHAEEAPRGLNTDDASATVAALRADVSTTDHFGVPVTGVRWRIASDDGAGDPDADPIQLAPCFAPLDRWLVIALSSEHLRALIEAYHDLRPALGAAPPMNAGAGRPIRSTSLAVAQPALAAAVLARWINEYQAGRASPFDPSAWIGSRTRARLARIGASVASEQFPGQARVVEVEPTGPAASRLLEGDSVLAVDGQVLSLEEPVDDLRRKLLHSRRAVGPILRVLRDGVITDVELAITPSQAATGLDRAIPAMRNMIQVGAGVEFASFSTWTAPPDEFAARLVLHFPPPAE
ncbi:MAG: hypothetical protein FLDDKLPJ_01037 [Phycisphaerae bacterium]|nr:hypothetical protein [Phycisphaerae bacterium]